MSPANLARVRGSRHGRRRLWELRFAIVAGAPVPGEGSATLSLPCPPSPATVTTSRRPYAAAGARPRTPRNLANWCRPTTTPDTMTTPQRPPITAATISRFQSFIRRATTLLPARGLEATAPAASRSPLALPAFEAFVREATPLVVEQIQATLHLHSRRLRSVCRWLLPKSSDILSAAGLAGDEVPYTRLIAWILWPEDRPDLALRVQRAWLKTLGLGDVSAQLTIAARPQTELATDGGRADLVMHFDPPDFILVVEAKVGAEEYGSPDAGWQTDDYPLAVRQRLGLPHDHPGAMVFLTPDGRQAHAEAAIRTTYEALTTTISETLSPEEVGPELRWAYAAVITHLLTHTSPGGVAGVEALRKCARLETLDLPPEQVLSNLQFLGPLCRSLRHGESS